MFFVEVVRVVDLLEGMQNGVEADSVVQGIFRLLLEPFEQDGFIGVVECIDDFIGKSHEAVNGINGLTQRRSQEPDAHGKRRTV